MGLLCKIQLNEKITGGEISQAQFIQMVYDGEGIEGYQSNKPYFSDVYSLHENFAVIQDCFEWEIIKQTNNEKSFIPQIVLQIILR
jgi:hypothetical protein